MKRLFSLALLAVFLVLEPTAQVAGLAAAEPTAPKKYAIPRNGSILLQVPVSWRETITKYEHQLFYDVTFWPRMGDDFRVTVGVHGPAPYRPRGPETEASRQRFMEEILRRTTLPQCEEKEIFSRKFSGAAGFGWVATLTYKHIKAGERRPGQYRHQAIGTYLVNGDLLSFMIESHEKDPQLINQTLEMLKSARKVSP